MANSNIDKKYLAPTGYGTSIDITTQSGYICPSDGVIMVAYGYGKSGYCYVTIGNLEQVYTAKAEQDLYGRTWVFTTFKGNRISIEKDADCNIKFVPYTY